jgi:hypothetical protein
VVLQQLLVDRRPVLAPLIGVDQELIRLGNVLKPVEAVALTGWFPEGGARCKNQHQPRVHRDGQGRIASLSHPIKPAAIHPQLRCNENQAAAKGSGSTHTERNVSAPERKRLTNRSNTAKMLKYYDLNVISLIN